MASMQQQPNVVNCSVFTLAFAVDILHGFVEMRKRFIVETMRSHLLNYFREATDTPSCQSGILFT